MNRKLKIGIVGTGNIFRIAHLKPLLGHPEAEIIAVCDINEQKAVQIAEAHGIAHVCTSYQDLLDLDGLDAIDICTPNLFHSEIAVAALHKGLHVFCEKPDAISPEEARKMADAAAGSGKILMTMRNNRFTPASQFLKLFVEEGNMGDVYSGRCGWLRRRGIPGKGGWFTTKEISGGGPLIDLGVHMIDLAVWLMGNPKPVTVSGATYAKFGDSTLSDSVHSQFGEQQDDGIFNVEDLATGFIRFENGATLQIEFSWASNIAEEMNFVELRATKAGSRICNGQLQLFTEMSGQLVDISPVLGKASVDAHGAHLRHFIDVVYGRAEPILTPEHGVDMIQILSALYRSAELGQEVRL
ncbi:MAG: oxidoreductase [Paenibacillaceae bacterium]|nr:oxidoreductase [Paenibacillaceae bacterium]